MTMRQYCLVSGGLFAIVAGAHLLRILLGVAIEVSDYPVPLQLSWLGVLVPGTLAFQAFRLRGRR
ncbi:MAG: hypothetical protein OEW35_12005 [Gammaproteobacteria bacterium]|nr:hypothetical protein [Gammaproteobacteria bacterium]MDH4254828.1 hypothetical protein [Gammaproteobacteria bacterium]MDH5310097.1 hypothetical protein [Gammaproteobacteria bacterium]